MKYLLFLFPIFLQAQCLIPTHSYRLICADEVRYADSIASGSRLYISSKNAFVTSPRSVFSLVNGYGQHFIQITNSANSQKVAINRAWINRIDSTSSNKALIYIKDISVTFTTTESYTAVKDSAIACFIRSVASGLATLSDGDYGDVVVSGGGLVMTVDKPDLGLHNLADGDFSVVADSTALSLTGTRSITLQTQNIDGWISRYLQTNNSLTLRTNNSTKTSRIFVDTTGANFQFVNGSNNASLRIGDSVAVRFNTSGSVGQVLTVTSVDGDGRLVINPKTGGSGTANCEQTLTKTSHGFRKWTPIYWNGSAWARPTFDSIIPTYIVVDSTTVNTFKVSNCGNYSSSLTAGLYYYKGASPGYSLTPTSIPTPLFEVAQSRLILQPLVGFNLAGGSGDVTSAVLADTAAAIRADFPNGIISALPLGNVVINGTSKRLQVKNSSLLWEGRAYFGQDSMFRIFSDLGFTFMKSSTPRSYISGTDALFPASYILDQVGGASYEWAIDRASTEGFLYHTVLNSIRFGSSNYIYNSSSYNNTGKKTLRNRYGNINGPTDMLSDVYFFVSDSSSSGNSSLFNVNSRTNGNLLSIKNNGELQQKGIYTNNWSSKYILNPYGYFDVYNYNSSGDNPRFYFYNARGSDEASKQRSQPGDYVGFINFAPYNGSTYHDGAVIGTYIAANSAAGSTRFSQTMFFGIDKSGTSPQISSNWLFALDSIRAYMPKNLQVGGLINGTTASLFVNSLVGGNVGINTVSPTSRLQVVGSVAFTTTTISSATTLGEHTVVFATGASNYLVTLPSASSCAGRKYIIKVNGGGKTISSFLDLTGSSSTTLTNNTVLTIVSDGTNWQQL